MLPTAEKPVKNLPASIHLQHMVEWVTEATLLRCSVDLLAIVQHWHCTPAAHPLAKSLPYAEES